jgi:type VI secretion system secreted protein Hcp
MAIQPYMSVKGQKQGQFKGETTTAKRKDKWIPLLAFTMGLKSPRDLATGQASGRRQFAPVTIVKQWGAASPQGLTACATNENLPEVVIEFPKTNPKGVEFVYQTVTLTDASISQIDRFTGRAGGGEDTPAAGHSAVGDMLELERWTFTFRAIQVEDSDGRTTFADDWMAAP